MVCYLAYLGNCVGGAIDGGDDEDEEKELLLAGGLEDVVLTQVAALSAVTPWGNSH